MYCEWYDDRVCPQKGCDGKGYVNCKARRKQVIYGKGANPYRNSKIDCERVNRVRCLSFLEKTLSEPSLSL